VSVHEINLHTHKGENDFNYSIISKRNPLKKDGKPSPFIEEARCDLEGSILFASLVALNLALRLGKILALNNAIDF
jgi:hypothetical protein